MNIKIIFSYDGTNYYGYAKQVNKVTIQSTIEKTLEKIFQEKIKIYASGRTDKGVHAIGQVANFYVKNDKKIDLKKIKKSLNKLLPEDIKINQIEDVPEEFNSRYSAVKKTYFYVINPAEPQLFLRNYVLDENRIDPEKITKGAQLFVGEHNFANFSSKVEDQDNFIRTIYEIKTYFKNDLFYIELTGNGFMRYMVRKIIGTLIEYSKGKITKEEIIANLNPTERKIINFTAPSKALYLKEVFY